MHELEQMRDSTQDLSVEQKQVIEDAVAEVIKYYNAALERLAYDQFVKL